MNRKFSQQCNIGNGVPHTRGDEPCPAQIQADTDALTSSANAYANSASNSETQAGISESNAGNSETNANTSAVNASLAHDQAVIAKNTAQTHEANTTFLYNAFSAYYLGAKASAPTVDNLGNPLVQGALYWDTTLQLMQVRNATTWQPL